MSNEELLELILALKLQVKELADRVRRIEIRHMPYRYEGKQMTDSEKLARWQGWKVQPRGKVTPPIPDYLNDDAAAMSLLDTLVEKGLGIQLYNTAYEMTGLYKSRWCCKLTKGADVVVYPNPYPTRREAVVAACLELIGKEDV